MFGPRKLGLVVEADQFIVLRIGMTQVVLGLQDGRISTGEMIGSPLEPGRLERLPVRSIGLVDDLRPFGRLADDGRDTVRLDLSDARNLRIMGDVDDAVRTRQRHGGISEKL